LREQSSKVLSQNALANDQTTLLDFELERLEQYSEQL
jgi:hypothetical protein